MIATIMEKIGVSPGQLIAQVVNFILLLILLHILVWKPLLRFLQERRVKIADALANAKVIEERRTQIEREREEVLHQAHAEATTYAETQRAEIDKQAKALITEAETRAKAICQKADDDARRIQASAIVDASLLFKDLVLEAAMRIVRGSLTLPENALREHDLLTVPSEALSLESPITVKSAIELTREERVRIQEAFGQRELTFAVELAILCGLVFQSGSQVVDTSGLMRARALQEALKTR